MTDTAVRRPPTAQRIWLAVYWVAAAINGVLLLQALLSVAELPLPSVVAVVLAFVSTLVGAIFATRVVRHGVSTTVFVRATTTVRVIAVAWIVLEIAIVSTAILAVLWNLDSAELDWSAGFAGTVGSISILAVVGPGYKEYREAMAPQ